MAKALYGEEKRKWLAANPGAAYHEVNSNGQITNSINVKPKADPGLIGNIINALVNPVNNALSGTAEQLRAGNQGNPKTYKPYYMSDDEWDQYVKNPVGKNLQNAIGLASYIPIPGLQQAGLAGAAAQGAASGLLSGIGNNDARQNLDVGNLATDALIGAGTGGVLHAGGKVLSKVFGKAPIEGVGNTIGNNAVEQANFEAQLKNLISKKASNVEIQQFVDSFSSKFDATPPLSSTGSQIFTVPPRGELINNATTDRFPGMQEFGGQKFVQEPIQLSSPNEYPIVTANNTNPINKESLFNQIQAAQDQSLINKIRSSIPQEADQIIPKKNLFTNIADSADNAVLSKYTKFQPQDVTSNLVDQSGDFLKGPEAQKALLQKVTTSGTGEGILNDVNKNFQGLRQELSTAVENNSTPVNGEQIYNNIINSGAGKIPGFNTSLTDADSAASIYLNELKGAKTVNQLADIYKKTQDALGSGAFNKLTADKATTDLENTLLHIERNVGKELKLAAPEVEPILNDMSTTHALKKSLVQQVNKGGKIKVPLLDIKVPGQGIIDSGVRKGASLFRTLGENGLPNINNLRSGPQNGIASALAGIAPNGQQQSQDVGNPNIPITQTGIPMINPSNIPTVENKRALAMKLINSGMKISDVKSIIDLVAGDSGGQQLPAAQLKDLADVQNSLYQLGTLQGQFEKDKNSFDPIGGAIRELNPLKGYDTQYQSNQAIINQVKQIIGKGLEGGVLRKEDEVKYEAILPKSTDTPDTVQFKISSLNDLLQTKYLSYVQSYQQGGYNPFIGQ